MPYNLQQLSDRCDIEDLTVEYCHLIDQQQFDKLENIFTEDAFIDYTAMGGIKGSRSEIIQFLDQSMGVFHATQHMISNHQIQLNGDTAEGRIICFNPMDLNLGEGKNQVFFLGLWYVDKYVRTAEGWRIKERIEEKAYGYNTPKGL